MKFIAYLINKETGQKIKVGMTHTKLGAKRAVKQKWLEMGRPKNYYGSYKGVIYR